MKKNISVIYFLIIICIFSSFTSCTHKQTVKLNNTVKYDTFAAPDVDSLDNTVCENESYKIVWDEKDKQVSFVEKRSGTVWSPAPVETKTPAYDADGMPIKNNANTQSAIVVHYFDPTTLDEKTALSYSDAVKDGMVYTNKIKNGIRVTYEFLAYEIVVPVEYTIEKDRFVITVHPEKIYDNGKNFVTGVSFAPFMCGIKNNRTDSWLFIPDGSGTIIYPNEIDSVGSIGRKSVYGDDATIQTYYFTSSTAQINLPVFGVKKDKTALLGVIESGQDQASISWNIGSQNVKYSSVYPFFRIRGYNLIKPPNGFNSPLTEVQSFDKQINSTVLSVAYYSLDNENADIYGMASTYRKYIAEKYDLEKNSKKKEKVGIKLIGGIEQKSFILGIPTSKLYPLTKLVDAKKIASEITESLSDDCYFDLVGFGDSGADSGKVAGGYSAASELGGKSELRRFTQFMEKNEIEWFMDFDLISFCKNGCGFSKKNAAVQPNGQIAWMQTFNTVTRNSNSNRICLISRRDLKNAAERLADEATRLGVNGISLDSLSNTKYSDYNSSSTSVCGNMSKDVVKTLDQIKKKNCIYLADAANIYSAVKADRIIDVPLYSSGYDFSDYDVPFYEMVLKGFVPMNSVSVNLCSNPENALLRCIEAGVTPSFTFTAHYDNELITSQHSIVFGTSYDGMKESVLNFSSELKNYLKSIENTSVKSYKVNGDLRTIHYDNGIYAVVNYSKKDLNSDYGSVPACGWISGKE